MAFEFEPGDLITNPTTGKTWLVMDPPFTSRGKLRLRTESGGYKTNWWRTPLSLPEDHRSGKRFEVARVRRWAA